MKKTLIILLLAFSSTFLSYSQKSDSHYRDGKTKFNEEDYSGAIIAFTKAIELNDFRITDPNGYNVPIKSMDDDKCISYWYRAYSKQYLNDYIGAMLDFNKAIQLNNASLISTPRKEDNKASLYEDRGYTKYQLKDYRGALQDYDIALSLRKRNPKLLFYKGLAYEGLHDYILAKDSYGSAILWSSSNVPGKYYYSMGLVEIKLGQKNSGCLNLSKAGELGVQDAYTMIQRLCN